MGWPACKNRKKWKTKQANWTASKTAKVGRWHQRETGTLDETEDMVLEEEEEEEDNGKDIFLWCHFLTSRRGTEYARTWILWVSLCIFRSAKIRDTEIRHGWFYARMNGSTLRVPSDFKRSQQLGNCRKLTSGPQMHTRLCLRGEITYTRTESREFQRNKCVRLFWPRIWIKEWEGGWSCCLND